jgi:hypothetical protein
VPALLPLNEGLLLFYAVVNNQLESVVEFFPTREQAEQFIAEVEQDEPETATLLRVEAVELRRRDRVAPTG